MTAPRRRLFHLDLPYLGTVPQAYRLPTQTFARHVGQNIGNLAFRHGLTFILRDIGTYERYHFRDLKQVNAGEQVAHSVLSCANWLGPGEAMEKANAMRIRALRYIDGPLICFGLGIQASLEDAGDVQLGPHTRRLAAILAERSRCIGLRDEISQDVLARLGITNTVVMGCPSNFINSDPQLGTRIAALAEARAAQGHGWRQTRSIISEYTTGHPQAQQITRTTLRLLAQSPAFYVIQTPVLMPFLFHETDVLPDRYAQAASTDLTAEQVKEIMRAKTLHFSSVESWMDMARSCHLSFGMRIHGTILPLQAGVPSVLIQHDARTAGLAHSMGIPTLSPEDITTCLAEGPRAFYEPVAQTMAQYDARRAALARIMLDFLNDNALRPHPGLLTLVTPAS